MKILAIETSSTACSVALSVDGVVTSSHVEAPMQQTKLLLPTIEALLHAAKIQLKDLNALACGAGPGSFTGVRIAVSLIQGLAFGGDIPVVLVSSLAAAAQTAYDKHGWKNLLIAVDARMNEIYTAAYQINPAGLACLVGEEQIISPSAISAHSGQDWYGVGNGWGIYENLISFNVIEKDLQVTATAESVLKLAFDKFKNNETVPASEALPVYLRNKVAEKQGKFQK